jgi:hypothetical protein
VRVDHGAATPGAAAAWGAGADHRIVFVTYDLLSDGAQDISERVILPITRTLPHGIEDPRCLEFLGGGCSR